MNKCIIEVYEKYKHMDKLLSDKDWLPNTIQGQIIYDLWNVIKHENDGQQKQTNCNGGINISKIISKEEFTETILKLCNDSFRNGVVIGKIIAETDNKIEGTG